MAGTTNTTVNPNYHLFGPSLEETDLARIAAGGGTPELPFGSDRARNMLDMVHGQRLQDDARYTDYLNGENQARTEQAKLANVGELLKGLLPATAHEGSQIGPVLRFLQGAGALPQSDTSMLSDNDRAAMLHSLSQSFQAIGTGVNQGREGGVATDAGTVSHMLGGLPGFSNVDPTRVQEAGVKAAADLKPKATYQTGGFGQNGKDGVQLTGNPADMLRLIQSDPNYHRLFSDVNSTLEAGPQLGGPTGGDTGLSTSGGLGGVGVGGGTTGSAAPSASQPGINRLSGADSNIPRDPRAVAEYNRVTSAMLSKKYQVNGSIPLPDGSVRIPYTRPDGSKGTVRMVQNPGDGNWATQLEGR